MKFYGYWLAPRVDGEPGWVLWRETREAGEAEAFAEPIDTSRFRWILARRWRDELRHGPLPVEQSPDPAGYDPNCPRCFVTMRPCEAHRVIAAARDFKRALETERDTRPAEARLCDALEAYDAQESRT